MSITKELEASEFTEKIAKAAGYDDLQYKLWLVQRIIGKIKVTTKDNETKVLTILDNILSELEKLKEISDSKSDALDVRETIKDKS